MLEATHLIQLCMCAFQKTKRPKAKTPLMVMADNKWIAPFVTWCSCTKQHLQLMSHCKSRGKICPAPLLKKSQAYTVFSGRKIVQVWEVSRTAAVIGSESEIWAWGQGGI